MGDGIGWHRVTDVGNGCLIMPFEEGWINKDDSYGAMYVCIHE